MLYTVSARYNDDTSLWLLLTVPVSLDDAFVLLRGFITADIEDNIDPGEYAYRINLA